MHSQDCPLAQGQGQGQGRGHDHRHLVFILCFVCLSVPQFCVFLFNQSINQHELAMAPHIQSSGAPEIQ